MSSGGGEAGSLDNGPKRSGAAEEPAKWCSHFVVAVLWLWLWAWLLSIEGAGCGGEAAMGFS